LVFANQNMKVQRSTLDNILSNNVCEIRFTRKIPVTGKPPTRRMWCTKSYNLLTSTNGKVSLNYRAPTHAKVVNESLDNILVVWDVFMQNYRAINMNDCELLQQLPADDSFWQYFNENLYPMSAEQKAVFMNS
jgi:hypothetical protein